MPETAVRSEFAPLIEQEIRGLLRYAVALTRDRDRAEDLVQDCLVRALAKQDLWQPGTNLRAWLFTILYNSRVSDLRRLAREGHRSEMAAEPVVPRLRWPDGRLELLELDRGIGELTEPQRQAFLLVCLEGISYEQAATFLGVPVGTVRSRVARARASLRAEFDRPTMPPSRAAAKSDPPVRSTGLAFGAPGLVATHGSA